MLDLLFSKRRDDAQIAAPGYRALVERPDSVRVQGYLKMEIQLTGW